MDMAMDQLPVAWPNVERSANFTADIYGAYIITGNCTVADPPPVQGKGYECYIRNGTATIGGNAHSQAGTVVRRIYHSGAWSTAVQPALSGAYSWTGQQTFTQPILLPDGTTALPALARSAAPSTGISFSGGVTVVSSSGTTALQVQNAQVNQFAFATHSAYIGRRANTSEAAPSQVLNGERVAEFRGGGYHDGGAYDADVGGMRVTARENYTSTATGTSLEFTTTAIGATGTGVRWRINPSGELCFGDNAPLTTFSNGTATPPLQLYAVGAAGHNVGLARFNAGASGVSIFGAMSRNSVVNTYVETQSGDTFFTLSAQGCPASPTNFREAARIRFIQDAASGASSVPGRISLETATSGGTVTEAMRIDSNQNTLHAAGTAALPSVSFIGDPDTGVYSSGTNQLGVTCGGVLSAFAQAATWNVIGFNGQGFFNARRANGSESSPTQLADGEVFGEFRATGYHGGGAYGTAARIFATAREAFSSASNLGCSLSFSTIAIGSGSGAVRWRINPGGQLCFGDNDAIAGWAGISSTPSLQLANTGAIAAGLARYSNDANPAAIQGAKSRGTSIGMLATTSSGDELFRINGQGVDTGPTAFREAARIRFVQDAAGGASAVPGRISLETSTTGGTVTEAMRVDSAQQVQHLATTASTSTTTGGSTFAGGVGIAGAAFIGQGVTVSRAASTDFGMRIATTAAGATAWSNGIIGLELVSGNINTSSKYTPFIKFGSTDADLVTTTPKFSAGISGYATETWAADTSTGMGLAFFTSPNAGGTGSVAVQVATLSEAGTYSGTGGVLSTSQTAGIGYATGAGGTVTQTTSRTTGVTLNRVTGAITLVSAAGSAAWQSFTVTNSAVAATDTIIVNQVSGTDLNMIHVTNIAAGSFRITFATTGGTTVEQPVFRFTVIKSVSA